MLVGQIKCLAQPPPIHHLPKFATTHPMASPDVYTTLILQAQRNPLRSLHKPTIRGPQVSLTLLQSHSGFWRPTRVRDTDHLMVLYVAGAPGCRMGLLDA